MSYVFSKSGPLTVVASGATTLPVTTFHFLGLTGPCPPPPYSVTMSATLTCVPAPSSAAIVGPLPLPAGASVIPFPLPIPAGPPRICTLAITSTVTAPNGATMTMTADQVVCIVDPSPSDPNLPRLDMTLLTPDVEVTHPGSQTTSVYRIVNNDPVEGWTGDFSADSRNVAGLPAAGGTPPAPGDGIHAISDPGIGDNFPIGFPEDLDPSGCLPLPPDPLTFAPPLITKPIFVPAGSFVDVEVYRRSWGMCANGSCSESTAVVDGLFDDGTDGFACAGVSHVLDTSAPPSYDWADSGAASQVFIDPLQPEALALTYQPSPLDDVWINKIIDSFFGHVVDGGGDPIPVEFAAIPLDNNYGRHQMQLAGNFNVDSFFDIAYQVSFPGSPASPQPVVQTEMIAMGLTGGPSGFQNESPGGMGALGVQFFGPGSLPFEGVLELTTQVSAYAHLDNGEILPMQILAPQFLPIPGTDTMQVQYQAFAPGAPPTAAIIGLQLFDDTRGFAFSIPPNGPCDGDVNADNVVDVNDLSYVLFRLGNSGAPGTVDGDANDDGVVDVNDISYVLFRLGTCAPSSPDANGDGVVDVNDISCLLFQRARSGS